MSVRLIIDSTADLPQQIKARLDVVPLTVVFGEEEYLDGVTITHEEFYEMLVETDVLPHTSQASPDAFRKVYQKVLAAGDSAVVVTIASALSGTYQSAVIAAEGLENICVVDSKTAAIGMGILAQMALRFIAEGLDAQTVARKLEKERENVFVLAMLDTLEFLQRGGRISKTAAIAGGLLGLKPVLSIEDGKIQALGKARGSRQANNLLAQEIEKAGGVDFTRPVLLGYTGLSDRLLQKYITDSADLWQHSTDELAYTIIGSVIGTHAGPGAVAVAFFKNNTRGIAP